MAVDECRAQRRRSRARSHPRLRWRSVATVAFALALLSPVVGSRDGFPLSTYPMYAEARSPDVTFIVAVGVSASGGRVELTTMTVAGTRDPLIAETYLRDGVEAGRVADVCRSVAARVARGVVVGIEIRSQRHDLASRGLGVSGVVDDRLLASCVVR